MSALGCCERIGAFLEKESMSDHRLKLPRLSVEQETAQDNASSFEGCTETFEGIEITALGPVTACKNRPSATVVSSSLVTDEMPVIVVKNGTFGWTKNGDPILHDVNFNVRPSKLTIPVGSVASGKSTLLKALLGETPSSKGFVHISTPEIAWCEQISWLIVSETLLTAIIH
jgi:ATP-binding cassette, subfamily C (CFTR/MRP), member 1